MNKTPALRLQLNEWGGQRKPFLFLADFEMEKCQAFSLEELDSQVLRYNFHGKTNWANPAFSNPPALGWDCNFIDASTYQQAFSQVQAGLQRGDSFLTNLTFPTQVKTNWSLSDIFDHTQARYKLWWKDHFVVFSPEIFVQIYDGNIYSNPMKGTLSGHLSATLLMDDLKEMAEHATIVDLIRNDLSQVAKQVKVNQYRYLERLDTHQGGLWQTSSLISGVLPVNYHQQIGDILFRLLPAGSISGAPKQETLHIIQQAEGRKRGYYTGIAALWDGYELDSCVLIRYLEKTDHGLQYWSGGGITAYSDWQEEYKELKEKVYLPTEAVVSTF